ncbi:hypothetical protein C8Q70DRAFT_274107 [Cubamyces menziesii]|nr:hypothetical protein C8Q70DRAFT_274107 [Cubamyces menziesii]
MEVESVGRFGTLSLLRRLPVESVATSYPIDDEELTIGRDQACSLRLYYPAVSSLHAKITFVERKAFLVVLGTNGLLLDDAPLFPAAATAPGPTTVPLQNNSVIEIHKKRFRFNYPPKHLRPALINTPSRATPMASRRPLRMSMIASAHVFTPRPSEDPRENLRILQSPLRAPFASADEEIVLAHSDTPRVVEEDKDLIILDEDPEPVLPLPLPVAPQAPRTPARRPRPSLHRVVLMRSAQRAAIQREIQMEEEQEVEEVEETIAAIAEVEEGDDDIQEIPSPHTQPQVTGWRKSLDLVRGGLGWALRGLSVEPKEEEQEPEMDQADDKVQEYVEDEDEEMHEHDEYDDYENENYDEQTHEGEHEHEEEHDVPRPLGRFMSPQIPRTTGARQPRMSLGVGHDAGPRRVRLVAPWKVSEIQVPDTVKEEEGLKSIPNTPASPATPRSPVKREKLTEEEREAIRARRRSALATPDNFFKGQAPGSRRTLFPNLAPLPSPNFAQPPTSSAEQPQSPAPIVKDETPSAATASSSSVKLEDDEKEDTAVLLARMKQMVEGVKQRQSLGRQSLNLSPRKREGGFSLLAPGHATAHAPSRILIEEDDPAPPAQSSDEEDVEMQDDDAQPEPAARGGSGWAPPETPRMSDLRHVFGRAHAEPSTPALTGVRDMFRVQVQGPTETPRMDGMKELLSTPAGYRPASPERQVAHAEPPADEPAENAEEEREQPIAAIPARASRGRKAPGTSKIARRTTVPAPARSTRAASQALEDTGEGHDHVVPRTRARTADGTVGQATRTTRAKPTEAKPATPEPQEEEGTQAPPATAARATRRTRQATDSSTTSSHGEDAAASAEAKPTRKMRAKTPTPAASSKPSTTRRGTRAKPIEVPEDDGEDDPLDSLSREDGPAAEEDAPVPAPAATRARRGTRSKIPTGAVKQEDAEPSLSADKADEGTSGGAAPRATRARRTPVPRQPTPSGTTGAGGRTGTRTRGGSTTAAAAPAVGLGVEPAIPEDKENTPEAHDEEEEDHHEEAKAPATRVRAAAGKTTKRVKKEPAAEAGEDALPAPRTRVTRTRAARS